MTPADLFECIAHFARRPMPALHGRHVYLWHGSAAALSARILPDVLTKLDLYQVTADLAQTPRAREEAAHVLRRAIETRLDQLSASAQHQQIIVVTGCDLLSRYEVPARPFFTIASEHTMLILVIDATDTQFRPALSAMIPDYVVLDAAAPLTYLTSLIGDAATVHATEERP